MTTVDLTLSPGTYVVGIDRPWFVTQGMVRSKLESNYGVSAVSFYPRGKPPAAAALVSPLSDPYYSNDWDEWLVADYRGAPRLIRGLDKVWAWMAVVPPAAPAGSPRAIAPSPASILSKLPPPPKAQRMTWLPDTKNLNDLWVSALGSALGYMAPVMLAAHVKAFRTMKSKELFIAQLIGSSVGCVAGHKLYEHLETDLTKKLGA